MNAHARLGARIAVLLGTLLAGSHARAAASVVLKIVDDAGSGFNDPTPATPVGGNTGTTVGEQRRIAFQTAADAWGRILESPVPIVVEAGFAALTCTNAATLAGHAGAITVTDYPGLPTTGKYPLGLANRIMGRDLYPDEPDIQAEFNSGLQACMGIDWYYGLDGKEASKDVSFLSTVMHELTHGLGFADGVDPDTGVFESGVPSAFADYVLDQTNARHWTEMTDDERKASLAHARNLVWDGKRVRAVAARLLAKGAPSVQVSPPLASFSSLLSEANFGRLMSGGASITGALATVTLSACSVTDGTFAAVSGKIALIFAPKGCMALGLTYYAEKSGALAVLITYGVAGSPPPTALEASTAMKAQYPVSIPTLAVTLDDANLLKSASASTTVTLSADTARLVGADSAGNTMMYASNPVRAGSTGAHWDPLVRPNLTLEPAETSVPHDSLEMERALLWDIGWTGTCGNGTSDDQEECDDGAANSDSIADACRLDCKKPRCGDGTVDTGEQCDPGYIGVSRKADANCRADCTKIATVGTGGTTGTGGGSGTGGAGGSGGTAGGGGQSGSGGTAGSGGTTGKGGSSGSGGTSGSGGSGGTTVIGGSGGTSTSGGSSGGTTGSGSTGNGSKSGGCNCTMSSASSSSGIVVLTVGAIFMLGLRTRRRHAHER
jgi:MYXO-CTERM domain-containing protein